MLGLLSILSCADREHPVRYTAGGSEPGWSLQAIRRGERIDYDLTVEYGQTTHRGSGRLAPAGDRLLLDLDEETLTTLLRLRGPRRPCHKRLTAS